MSTSGIIQDGGVNALTLRKYNVSNENFAFNLHHVFQEYNPGVKQDLPVVTNGDNEFLQQPTYITISYRL